MKDSNIHSIALSEMYEEIDHEVDHSKVPSRTESQERENTIHPHITRTVIFFLL